MAETDGGQSEDQIRFGPRMAHDEAQAELHRVTEGDHTERELLDAKLKAVRAEYALEADRARQANEEVIDSCNRGVRMEDLEVLRLSRDSSQWKTQLLRDEAESLRQQIADNVVRELTASSLHVADKAAKAAQRTACATIALVVATCVLIVATLVAALN